MTRSWATAGRFSRILSILSQCRVQQDCQTHAEVSLGCMSCIIYGHGCACPCCLQYCKALTGMAPSSRSLFTVHAKSTGIDGLKAGPVHNSPQPVRLCLCECCHAVGVIQILRVYSIMASIHLTSSKETLCCPGGCQADGGSVLVCVGAQRHSATCARRTSDLCGHRHDGLPWQQRSASLQSAVTTVCDGKALLAYNKCVCNELPAPAAAAAAQAVAASRVYSRCWLDADWQYCECTGTETKGC